MDHGPLNRQVGGSHYKSTAIQPVEYIRANNLDYFEGNAVKYITRHRIKGGADDIKKAIHYLQFILYNEYENEEKEPNREREETVASQERVDSDTTKAGVPHTTRPRL